MSVVDLTNTGRGVQTVASSASAATIDFNNGMHCLLDLTAATGTVTVTLQNLIVGAQYIIEILQSATQHPITFSPAAMYAGGAAPTYGNGSRNILVFFYDGTRFIEVSRSLAVA